MARERTVDLFVLLLNVLAIMLLVGILSVMVTTADAGQNESGLDNGEASETRRAD